MMSFMQDQLEQPTLPYALLAVAAAICVYLVVNKRRAPRYYPEIYYPAPHPTTVKSFGQARVDLQANAPTFSDGGLSATSGPPIYPGVEFSSDRVDDVGKWSVRSGASVRPDLTAGPADALDAATMSVYHEATGTHNGWDVRARASTERAGGQLAPVDLSVTGSQGDVTVRADGSMDLTGDPVPVISRVRGSRAFNSGAYGRETVHFDYDVADGRMDTSVGYDNGDTSALYSVTDPSKLLSVRQTAGKDVVSADLSRASDGRLQVDSVEVDRKLDDDTNAVASWKPGERGVHVVGNRNGWKTRLGAVQNASGIAPHMSASRTYTL